MLNWIFKKPGLPGLTLTTGRPATKPAAPTPAAAPPAPGPARAKDSKPGLDPAAARLLQAQWAERLQGAAGDDRALLQVAQAAPLLEVKIAAVQALQGEAALKQAEREFRQRDRKVHKLAKQRLDAAVERREANARAQELIDDAAALAAVDLVPVNHLVALDHKWQALPADALAEPLLARWSTLRRQLEEHVRAAAERQQRTQRWLVQAQQTLNALQTQTLQVATQGQADDLRAAVDAAQSLAADCPSGAACITLQDALTAGVQDAARVMLRLQWLDAAQLRATAQRTAAPAAATSEPGPATAETEAATTEATAPESAPADVTAPDLATPDVATPDMVSTGEDAPAVDGPGPGPGAGDEPQAIGVPAGEDPVPETAAPGGDGRHDSAPAEPAAPELATPQDPPAAPATAWDDLEAPADPALVQALQARWQQLQVLLAPPPAAPAPKSRADRPPRAAAADAARRNGPDADQRQRLDALLAEAEQASNDGEPALMLQQLQALDTLLEALKGWQPPERWNLRHQALVAERARLNAWRQWGGGRARDDLAAEAEALARATQAAAEAGGRKLSLKSHAEAIQTLRARWKELDRLGAAASQALWHRFDAALRIAHEPVAVHQAALKAARKDNLAQRQALLDTLEARADQPAEAAPETSGTDADGGAHFWKDQLRALDQFHTAWRQLGPLEHTVPSSARAALQQRLEHALARLEGPLQAVRGAAAQRREDLVAQAEALRPAAGRGLPRHELVGRVRDLQQAWQHEARALPLPRGVENALWMRFKAATDAVFAEREAALHARDAELAANLAAREQLLDELSAAAEGAADDGAAVNLPQALARFEAAWRQAGDVPRAAVPALDARYHAVQGAVQAALDARRRAAQRRHWDDLHARLALCEAREDGGPGDAAASGWPEALPAAPRDGWTAAWDLALQQRWAAGPAPGPLAASAFDDLLLELEAALDLPASEAQVAARRQLKLRALKATLEGGRLPATSGGSTADKLAAALRQSGASAAQRQRLHALLQAQQRARPPR